MDKQTINSVSASYYDQKLSKMISGIAILLMLILHIWGNKGWRIDGNECLPLVEYHGFSLMRLLGVFAGICVNIFAFNNGYAIWVRSEDFSRPLMNLKRALRFLVSYWVIMAWFFLIPFFTTDSYPDGKQLLLNLFGINCGLVYPNINVVFAWYVSFYLLVLMVAPFFLYVIGRCTRFVTDLAVCIGLYMVILFIRNYLPLPFVDLNYNLPYFGSVLIGMLAAKYNLLQKIGNKLIGGGNWVLLAILLIVVVVQLFLSVQLWAKFYTGLQEINVLILIAVMIMLFKRYNSGRILKFLTLMGTYSLNIWFLHGIFFTESRDFQWLLYWPKYSVLVMVWAWLLLLPLSYVVTRLQQWIIKTIKI